MNERRPGFAPKIRQREVIPVAQKGMEITRVNGKLCAVPKKGNDPYFGGSAYTERQLNVIIAINKDHLVVKVSANKNSGSW